MYGWDLICNWIPKMRKAFQESLVYTVGIRFVDPKTNNEGLKPGLADAQAAASRSCTAPSSRLFGDAFFDSEIWAKLMADPSERMKLQ
jgi:hypothetical protein